MPFTLRDNQQGAITALWDYVHNESNYGKNPLVSAPVAFGKSITIAEFNRLMVQAYPYMQILCLVHVKELVDQNYAKFKLMCPNISSGLYMDALGEKDHTSQVIYGSVHSVANGSHLFSPSIIVVDECHWIQKTQTGMYRSIIDDIKTRVPNCIVIGWTGTEWRMDGGPLAEGDDKLFDDVFFADTIRGMLDKGYHSPLVVPDQAITNTTDTSTLAVNDEGHQSEKAMAKLMDDMILINNSVDEYRRLSVGRKKHLVFGTTIKHCKHLKESFSRYYKCEFVHGGMKQKVREKAIQDYKDGKLDMLISGIILTTGFDEPRIDCIGLFRSVSSSALYIQIAGRGLRIHPDKKDCLWLDFTSTTAMHGPVDEVVAPIFKPKGSGDAVKKQCFQCQAFVYASVRICPECGAEFDMEAAPAHEDKTNGASILGRREPATMQLTNFRADRYTIKKTGKEALMFRFTFGLSQYTAVIDFTGQGRYSACQFWKWLAKDEYKGLCPESRENALMLINDMQAFNLPRFITFDYTTHYNGQKGRTALSSPRMDKIIEVGW